MKCAPEGLVGWTVESRPCGQCGNIKRVAFGCVCPKLLMAVTPTLYVMFEDSKGTCFEPKDAKANKRR